MLKPKKYIIKMLEKKLYEVKDYISKISTWQINRIAFTVTPRVTNRKSTNVKNYLELLTRLLNFFLFQL